MTKENLLRNFRQYAAVYVALECISGRELSPANFREFADRKLRDKTLAATAENDDQPALGQRPQGAQHILQRVMRVGIVYKDDRLAVGAADSHTFKSSGNGRTTFKPLAQRPGEGGNGVGGGSGVEGVGYVVPADQRQLYLDAAPRTIEARPAVVGGQVQHRCVTGGVVHVGFDRW